LFFPPLLPPSKDVAIFNRIVFEKRRKFLRIKLALLTKNTENYYEAELGDSMDVLCCMRRE
jgi:hypothetical protein